MNIVVNYENFQRNSPVHNISTRNKYHLHRPNASLSCFQKSTFCDAIRIFSSVPHSLTVRKNYNAEFKVAPELFKYSF